MIEELGHHDTSLEMGTSADHVSTIESWGPCYFLDDIEGSESVHVNYFVSQVAKVARYALPFVKNIDLMLS